MLLALEHPMVVVNCLRSALANRILLAMLTSHSLIIEQRKITTNCFGVWNTDSDIFEGQLIEVRFSKADVIAGQYC